MQCRHSISLETVCETRYYAGHGAGGDLMGITGGKTAFVGLRSVTEEDQNKNTCNSNKAPAGCRPLCGTEGGWGGLMLFLPEAFVGGHVVLGVLGTERLKKDLCGGMR